MGSHTTSPSGTADSRVDAKAGAKADGHRNLQQSMHHPVTVQQAVGPDTAAGRTAAPGEDLLAKGGKRQWWG